MSNPATSKENLILWLNHQTDEEVENLVQSWKYACSQAVLHEQSPEKSDKYLSLCRLMDSKIYKVEIMLHQKIEKSIKDNAKSEDDLDYAL